MSFWDGRRRLVVREHENTYTIITPQGLEYSFKVTNYNYRGTW